MAAQVVKCGDIPLILMRQPRNPTEILRGGSHAFR